MTKSVVNSEIISRRSLSILSFGLIILFLAGSMQSNFIIQATTATEIPTYMISTRGILNYEGIEGPAYGNYSFLNITNLFESCPHEIIIFVHGWNIDEDKSKERLDRVKMSLEHNNYYNISLIGFSWGSDTEWHAAKSIAKWNGPRLADFILDLSDNCKHQYNKDVKVRIIGHSLGARVILSSLDTLNKTATANNSNFKIASVHLLGAAVDDEEISKNPQDILDDLTNWGTLKSDYGIAIEEEVIKFYNLFNPQDNVFEPNLEYPFSPVQIYPSFEGDLALGYKGSLLPAAKLPNNHISINVQDEIKNISDADAIEGEDLGLCDSTNILFYCKVKNEGWDYGLCNFITMFCLEPPNIGDNHAGYIGFRNRTDTNLLANDGAMNVVVSNWRNS
jgi:pimeloyl-ACP methyl ester carboxylesterase